MLKHKVVIGLGFGDESKGLTTDFLVEEIGDPNLATVVRFSGGQQAGHTVHRNGVAHVFSNFGSGTLYGVPTYWGKSCTIDPPAIIREYQALLAKGVQPVLYINDECPVTTPYDKVSNQINDMQNGTCGTGFGRTLKREEEFYSLKAVDLLFPSVFKEKLNSVIKYYDKNPKAYPYMAEFLAACDILPFINNIKIVDHLSSIGQMVFEGSQGLMLDQDYGIFPHVTRGKTDLTNVISQVNPNMLDVYFVTRAYQTRHGNGPMTNTDKEDIVNPNPNETNVTNTFQGNFRTSMLDLDLLRYALRRERNAFNDSVDCNLVVTCLEQMKKYAFTIEGTVMEFETPETFVTEISRRLGVRFRRVLYSNGPSAKDIKDLTFL
jgi:adenylosuccinate synthase